MTNFDNEDTDEEVEGNEPAEGGGAAPSNSRNFLLALGILGGLFILILIVLAVLFFSRQPANRTGNVNIAATNDVIRTANAKTEIAATQEAGLALTPSVTPVPSETLALPTATQTQVLVQATATVTGTKLVEQGGPGGLLTVTPNLQTRTATLMAVLTQNAQTQTQMVKAKLTATASALPKTGFAEDVGLPGLFGMAIGLVLVIVLVRRLRLSPHV